MTSKAMNAHKEHGKSAKTTTAAAAAIHVADIGVKLDGEMCDTYITGLVPLAPHTLVVVDYISMVVKLINPQISAIINSLVCDNEIWDVVAVGDKQVAVTCPGEQAILFINVTDVLTVDHKVNVDGRCRGIARVENNFVVTYDDPVKVEIMSRSGQLIQTVVPKNRGRQLFTLPWYVAVSPDGHTVYISDYNRGTVTSVDRDGQVKASYENIQWSRGLAVDRRGFVYVCGQKSNSVLQLTPDLHTIQTLPQEPDDIVSPTSVAHHGQENFLYIGMQGSSVLKVYQLH